MELTEKGGGQEGAGEQKRRAGTRRAAAGVECQAVDGGQTTARRMGVKGRKDLIANTGSEGSADRTRGAGKQDIMRMREWQEGMEREKEWYTSGSARRGCVWMREALIAACIVQLILEGGCAADYTATPPNNEGISQSFSEWLPHTRLRRRAYPAASSSSLAECRSLREECAVGSSESPRLDLRKARERLQTSVEEAVGTHALCHWWVLNMPRTNIRESAEPRSWAEANEKKESRKSLIRLPFPLLKAALNIGIGSRVVGAGMLSDSGSVAGVNYGNGHCRCLDRYRRTLVSAALGLQ
ncbi:hypothetical protein DFH09DRAFT_1269603 [Mycena vulgaris]|nr:hypothetical protein DFH09DRAFT_1269603 [Mycena vulgaris]